MLTMSPSGIAETRTPALDGAPLPFDVLPDGGPSWLASIRQDALNAFNALGLPDTKHEDWRYTSLRALIKRAFRLSPSADRATAEFDIDCCALSDVPGPRLVFVDGVYKPSLSTIDALPAGLSVSTIDEAITRQSEFLAAHLGRHADASRDAFAALNLATFTGGAFIHIARAAEVAEPVTVLSVTTPASSGRAMQARTLIVAEDFSRAAVIEDFVSIGDEACFVNGVTEVSIGANANVTHCFLERENASTINVATLAARHQRDSRFTSHSILAGGGLVRNNVNPILEGENITSTLNGIYVGRDEQHLDNSMRVEHRAANCRSRQYYKGILADESHGVFTGRIIVSKGAQKTDAVQSNQNLLLSRSAQSQTRPQLEIYADDVKCTHGATIGELDEDAFFYLRARGLSEADARAMLVYAFASESLERIDHEGLRRAVTRLVLDRLPESGALAGAIE